MRPALDDGRRCFGAAQLDAVVADAAALLAAAGTRVLATVLDNTAAFVALDEAAAQLGLVHVPLPQFFSEAQMHHALQAAGVDTLLLGAPAAAAWPVLNRRPVDVAGESLLRVQLPAVPAAMPAGTVKITFTSGTTGAPKGVCLGADALQRVARGVVAAMAPLRIERHLNALPFAVLLENVAGLMAPRLHGATLLTLPLRELGWRGSSSFDAALFQTAVQRHQPHSLILLPQMPMQRRRWASLPARAMACPKARRCRRSTCPAPSARAAPAARWRMRGCASPPTARSWSPAACSAATSATPRR